MFFSPDEIKGAELYAGNHKDTGYLITSVLSNPQ